MKSIKLFYNDIKEKVLKELESKKDNAFISAEELAKSETSLTYLHPLIPRGCMIEVVGYPGSGKTSLALLLVKEILIRNPQLKILYLSLIHI